MFNFITWVIITSLKIIPVIFLTYFLVLMIAYSFGYYREKLIIKLEEKENV